LDATIKIFYHDTLKFFLSLYGHKLPVLSFDISSDNTLLASVSADKTIKLWGLDFGDCHKSMIGHEDSIMQCQFVWGTHYLFTVSKDRTVKYWDCDTYEQIVKLSGHHGEVWALAVGKYGNLVVSGSHDRSIRVWQKTDEQLYLEEEREREMEEMFEKATIDVHDRQDRPIGSGVAGPDGLLPDVERDEIGMAGKTTAETLKAGERIIEALDVWDSDRVNLDRHQLLIKTGQDVPPPQRNPYIIATGNLEMLPEEYVLSVVEKVRSGDLEEALLVLPFSRVAMLLTNVAFWIKKVRP
jgi:U3 small nucleolar RNA-associated protein 12